MTATESFSRVVASRQNWCSDLRSWASVVNSPVDNLWLAVYRILFGTIMCVAMVRFLAKGWVNELLVRPSFHFTYPGFSWVQPWPEFWMHAHVALLAVAALGVALGCFYRWCIALFFVGFTYLELIDQANYLNHYYLISLISGLLLWMPAHRTLSVDAWRRPDFASGTTPRWTLLVLRFQVGLVYFFAGVAKINSDWLLEAQPLKIWLASKETFPFIGSWLATPWAAYAASWFGAAFDLSVVFLLLARRTRPWAYALLVLFHVTTGVLFPIGMFPWIMAASATVFFSPNWPRWFLPANRMAVSPSPMEGILKSCWSWAIVSIYLLWQLLFPLRGLFQPGPIGWTYQGFNFAWRVMIVEKADHVEFTLRDPQSSRSWKVRNRDHLTPYQERLMAQDPEMIRAFATHLAGTASPQGTEQLEVRARAYATLNGRPSQLLIDPNVDLASPGLGSYILPLRPNSQVARQGD